MSGDGLVAREDMGRAHFLNDATRFRDGLLLRIATARNHLKMQSALELLDLG